MKDLIPKFDKWKAGSSFTSYYVYWLGNRISLEIDRGHRVSLAWTSY